MTRRGVPALLCALLLTLSLCACGRSQSGHTSGAAVTGHMDLSYAEQFSVDYLADGSDLLTIGGKDKYLILPQGAEPPADPAPGTTVLRRPISKLYLASSSAADLFLQTGALSTVRFTGTAAANWRIPEVRAAVESGDILYAGKYSAPDFELLLSEGCDLAVENTMLYHSPDIREQLERVGIPVLVERSSYEPHPLGRVEWVKVYGLLTGHEAEAEQFFSEQVNRLSDVEQLAPTGRTVAFFHISTSGAAVVRRPGDYVSKMIALAGGAYVFDDLEASDSDARSTLNMQMESFYAGAREADILIYNSTIDGELNTLSDLLAKSSLLKDFKAVRTGNVWCTEQNMFQKTSAAAGMITDLHAVFTDTAEEDLTFLHRLT
jgi:iron complex transport system substrate-binding protein